MPENREAIGAAGAPTPWWRTVLSHDLPASLVVFLVALPLSMGIALASGAPILSGLIAAVVGGIVVGLLGGAPLLVSGPAAGLAVMVFGFIQQFGLRVTCAAVVAAGLLQLAMGAFRVARISLAISPAVIHGMLAGIGILIVLGQLHVVLGGKPQASPFLNVVELPEQLANLHGTATFYGLLTIAILVAWNLAPGMLKRVPSQLVAVVGVTALGAFTQGDAPRVQVQGQIWDAIQLPTLPQSDWIAFASAVLSLAIVASAESLLSAVATDKLHTGPRADLDRELMGQGLANTLSGLLGGLPITGVIVRSAANIAAGAKTRASAVLHGVWLLLFVSLLSQVISLIPLAVLAGLLVVVGARLVNVQHIRELSHSGEAPIYFATVAGVVGINLLAGIGIGVGLSILRLLWKVGRLHIDVRVKGGVHIVECHGALTFVGVPHLTHALAAIPRDAHVRLDLSVNVLDHSGYEALHGWCVTHRRLGGTVESDVLEDIWHEDRGRPARAHGLSPRPAAALSDPQRAS